MDKAASLGYLGEKLLDQYMKEPPKVDINSLDSVNEFISGAPQPFSNTQLLAAPLLLAGAGGLAGYLGSSPQNRKRNAFVGALGGGMIGGGASLGYKFLGGLHNAKARENYTLPAQTYADYRDNLKLLEDNHKSWNPFKGELVEQNTGRPISPTELPHRIEKVKKLLELWPQLPDAAEKYQQQRTGVGMGMAGGGMGLTLAKILDESTPAYPEAKRDTKPKKDKKPMNAKTQKKADATAAIMGGLGGLVPGAVTGAGAGGLYGLASGAYQAEKGKKLRGALTGLGRGLVGGGLIGGGVGAGAGAGAGAMLPQGLFSPFGAVGGGLQVAADPIGTAARSALGGVGGAALGGYLGNKARKSTLGEPKQDDEKSEEKSEKKDNKSEEKEERKAAGAKQADLYGAFTGGSNLGLLGGLGGAGVGGLYGLASGAYQAPKGQKLQGALRGAGRGAVGGGLLGGGTGLGLGAAMGGQIPLSALVSAAKEDAKNKNLHDDTYVAKFPAMRDEVIKNTNPDMFAGLTAAGTLGGAALGGYAAEKALNGKKEDEDKKEAELKLSPLAGVKKPDNDKGKSLNNLLEEARKKREEKEKNMPQQNKAANDWKPFDYSNVGPGGLISTRTLPKSDGTGGASHWKPSAGLPVQRPANTTLPMKSVPPQQPRLVPVAAQGKAANAFEYGKMVKKALGLADIGNYARDTWNSPTVQGFVNDPTTRAGLTYGGIGAGLGGLYGMINPGEYEDETGNVRRRGRLSGALRGALGGGAIGGLAGAGAQEGRFQYLKHMLGRQNNEDSTALPHVNRATQQQMVDSFAENNPDLVGALGTSPLQSANSAYSAASNAVKGFMPKRMGKAPATGVATPANPPEVKPAN
jgi:hypothetical protein